MNNEYCEVTSFQRHVSHRNLLIFVNSLPELDINIQTTFISGDQSKYKLADMVGILL